MKLRGTHTSLVDVEIDVRHAADALIAELRKMYDLKSGEWVNGLGQVCRQDDFEATTWTSVVGQATDGQRRVDVLTRELRRLVWEAPPGKEKS